MPHIATRILPTIVFDLTRYANEDEVNEAFIAIVNKHALGEECRTIIHNYSASTRLLATQLQTKPLRKELLTFARRLKRVGVLEWCHMWEWTAAK